MDIYKDIRSYVKLPDYVTLIGLICSILSIFFSIRREFIVATLLIVLSTVFDYYDGRVARKIKREGNFGRELDNLCDVVLYLISVSIFGYMVGLNNILAIFIFLMFIISGVVRLARFALLGIEDGYYRGLPVGFSVIIPFVYFILRFFNISIMYLLLFYFIPSFFMISTIKVRKAFSTYLFKRTITETKKNSLKKKSLKKSSVNKKKTN
jgi:CDP-diacylglycerol---serine O-phosphatidyltransferase